MSVEWYSQERLVRCPELGCEATVRLERSETEDGETVHYFHCSVLEESPGCRKQCLSPSEIYLPLD